MAGRHYSRLFLQAKPSLSNPQATSQNSDALTTWSRYIWTPCLQWNRSVDNTHLYTLEIHPGSELLTFSLVQIYTHHNIPSDVLIDFILKLSRITIMPFMTNTFEDINKSGFWFVFKQFCMFLPRRFLPDFFFFSTMALNLQPEFWQKICKKWFPKLCKEDGENFMQIRFYFNVC